MLETFLVLSLLAVILFLTLFSLFGWGANLYILGLRPEIFIALLLVYFFMMVNWNAGVILGFCFGLICWVELWTKTKQIIHIPPQKNHWWQRKVKP